MSNVFAILAGLACAIAAMDVQVNDWLAATPSGTETLPRDVAERVERVIEFHKQTKYSYKSMRLNPIVLDWKKQPSAYRAFPELPKVALPTSLVDAPVAMVPLLAEGLAAVPESLMQPPQNLRTLATWLYLAYGMSVERTGPGGKMWLRTCPSSGALYPCEIYVAAFAIEGLEPGLYHYSIREFALRKMREGIDTLNQIKRGRPDLNFLNSVPAALLVSTVYCRSTWRYRQRGYPCALLDAGHLVQNVVSVANGLGIQTMPRLLINDNTMRDLIGIAPDADFGTAESVQAMVVWADSAAKPISAPAGARPPSPGSMRPIVRAPLTQATIPYGSILATHQDCVAPGMPVREIRPPYTELAPMLESKLTGKFDQPPLPNSGPTVRQVALTRRSTRQFSRGAISRDQFILLNRLSFRGGTVVPLFPDGPHAALLRPFWIVNAVAGMEPGVWYYDPAADRWATLRHGDFRTDAAYLSTEQPMCGDASAVCFMMSNLQALVSGTGPDAYRLAHLEAGLMGQRIYQAATALGICCCGISTFYDDDVRNFFGLEKTGWEPVYEVIVGLAPQ